MKPGWIVMTIFACRVCAQDYGVFLANDADGRLISSYKIANASTVTNVCADSASRQMYRVVVTSNEYAAGWNLLPQAKKDAAKAAAQTERSDFEAKFEKLLKAFALVTLDEINTERSWLASFKTAVAAATSLAELKAGVAALPNMPDRTVQQLKDAVRAKYEALP